MNIVFDKDILTKFFDCSLHIKNFDGSSPNENSIAEKTFHVHKIILANTSIFFKKLFEKEDSSEYTISVSFTTETFEKYLNFLYTGEVDKRTNVNDYINGMLMYSYFELVGELKKLIFEMIDYVEEQFHLHKNTEDCQTICNFLADYDVLDPKHRENLFYRIGYMIGKNTLFDSGVSNKKQMIFITQRQDGKYTDFDAEQFKYKNLVFNASCAGPLQRDSNRNIVHSIALPHDNLKECSFHIVSWPLICEPIPEEKKVALAASTQRITQTRETQDYRWKTYKEFEKNKVQMTAKVFLGIINGFDKPMTFKVFREKDTILKFPRAIVHAGTNEIESWNDSVYFKYQKDNHNIYRNTLYRFIVIFD